MKILKANKVTIINLLFLFIFIQKAGISQSGELGVPFIQNFTPKEYGYESQNYSIVQDRRGVLYVGNLNGIIEYDGINWRLISLSGEPKMSAAPDGRIYAGGYNDFGYLKTNFRGEQSFYSLVSQLPKNQRNFGQVEKVMPIENEVLFIAGGKFYRYYSGGLELVDVSEEEYKAFKVNNSIFVFKPEVGLMKYKEGVFTLVTGGDWFIKNPVQDILPFEKGILIKLEDKGFVTYNNIEPKPFFTQADNFLLANEYQCGVKLSDGNYAFGTKRCGIVIVDVKGNLIFNLNKENGLNDDEIIEFYVDRSDHLWASLNFGFSRIETPSAFSYFSWNSGIKGGLSSVIRHDGIVYIATTQGVFYLSDQVFFAKGTQCAKSEKFIPVEGITANCNRLFSIEGELLVSTVDGLYKIEGFEGKLISQGVFEDFYRSKSDPSIIYLAKSTGVSAMKIENGKWVDLGKFNNLTNHIRTIAEDDHGNLWLGSNYDGIFKADISTGFYVDASVQHYKNSHGLPENHRWIDVYATSSGVLFSTQKGIYRYDDKTGTFFPDTTMGIDFARGNTWVFPIREDDQKNIWLSSGFHNSYERQTMVCKRDKKTGQYKKQSAQFQIMDNFTVESIFPDENGIVWFGGFDGLIRYDSRHKDIKKPTEFTLIRSVVCGKDSIIYNGGIMGSDSLINDLTYNLNSVRFEFAAPLFNSAGKILYRYYLEGFDKEWSDWSKANMKEYTNLSEGTYTFRVQAKDKYGNVTQEAGYTFTVRPPFYRVWIAYLIYLLLAGTLVLAIVKYREYQHAQEKHKLSEVIRVRTEELVIQKERAEEVLANVLPKQTADELKSEGKAKSQRFKLVTVLFSDIQGFTKIAEEMNPEALIDELDKIFFYFDSIVEKYNIEKIKTIGDAYMCAGGIPQKNRTNPIEVVLAALDMQRQMDKVYQESEISSRIWGLRIGVHTGPVIAGVIGTKKYTYDIWGDTVNIASRMESSGFVGKVNITGYTHELIKEYFECEYRGKMPVKYKGEIDMYFVNRLKPEYSDDPEGAKPNQRFKTKFQLIRLSDIEELVMNKMEKELPKNLYYHNLKHTVDVITQVELLGRAEGLSDEEMLLVKTAAIFHDTGFTIGYDDHELLGIKIAQDMLPRYDYSDNQIQTICELIYSTKHPPEPKNLLEEILCDADLDYLGRGDFIPVSQNLFRELFERNKIKTIEEWNRMQLKFIESHQYFTETARQLRNVNKANQLEKLRSMI